MHLVVHQVVQLEHVHIADRHRSFEGIAGATVVQCALTGFLEPRQPQQLAHLLLGGAVEHRCGDRHAATQVTAQRQ